MNIALIAHDAKKELLVQFCIAYCGIISRHDVCATGTTGKLVHEATGLNINCFFRNLTLASVAPVARWDAICGLFAA